jgi:hypothetical protein
MNKKDQKTKESNNKLKADNAKTDQSVEKTNNNNKEKAFPKENNISILETQPQINDKNTFAKKEKINSKNNNANNNINQNKENSSNGKNPHEPTPEDYQNANAFIQYIDESGLPEAFQLIFAELVSKKINPQNFYSFVGMRLRQIGKELNDINNN